MKRAAILLQGLLLFSAAGHAQFAAPYVVLQGTLTGGSGLPAKNATLAFMPSQTFFVAGSMVVVQPSQCSTDNGGAVVGVANPLVRPRVTQQSVGTLAAGTYYVRYAWYDQLGMQTLPSPSITAHLTGAGELQVLAPVGGGPPQAKGLDVYIGTAAGSETYQGQTVGLTDQYTQAAPLSTTGAVPPYQNITPCRVVANDVGWPTGTGYHVTLLDQSGNTIFSYPEMWQFFGAGSTYDLSAGIPYYHGQVTYPIPVLSVPYNHNPQSVSSPLDFTGYNLYNIGLLGIGTSVPAWGVDVEGAALAGQINARGGYLFNGALGFTGTKTAGSCVMTIQGGIITAVTGC